MSTQFELHERLAQDTIRIGTLPLCELLLMNDAQYPWAILVPRLANLTELHQVPESDQRQLLAEINTVSHGLEHLYQPHKINVATLGNQVAQLHIHVIARFKQDAAWPNPVWGVRPTVAYTTEQLDDTCARWRTALNSGLES